MYLDKGKFFLRRPSGMMEVGSNLLVRGSHHRTDEVQGFLNEFDRLKPISDKVKIDVFHDEGNKFDKHAMGVTLATARKTWLGWKNRNFHIGYVEAELAKVIFDAFKNGPLFTKLELFKTDDNDKYPYTIIISIYSEPNL